MCVCVCVCVCESMRGRSRGKKGEAIISLSGHPIFVAVHRLLVKNVFFLSVFPETSFRAVIRSKNTFYLAYATALTLLQVFFFYPDLY